MVNLEGLRIALYQMPVKPASPMFNASNIIHAAIEAEIRGDDFLVCPELCLESYLTGDKYLENEEYLRQVENAKAFIAKNTSHLKVIIIYGTLDIDWTKRGEDGRVRKYNIGQVLQAGKVIHQSIKTNQPNYRFMDDSKHFYSLRSLIEETCLKTGKSIEEVIKMFIRVVVVKTKLGPVRIGIILCEDMWKDDYNINPTAILAEMGVDIVFNLSASPWTWQKNRKRHQVVKNLLTDLPAPDRPIMFVYVNKGNCIDQLGKSILAYDGSSTVYNSVGDILFEMEQFVSGMETFVFSYGNPAILPRQQNDQRELWKALCCAVDGMFSILPPEMRGVVHGLSGGIDSAAMAALLVNRLGSNNVIGINMPYGNYNDSESCEDAKKIAENLGIKYLVIPIDNIANSIAEATGIKPNSFAFQNILARCRMEVLAAMAQKLGYVFVSNGNKVEVWSNFFTMYADGAGFASFFGDLVKREIYQTADYENREVFGREVIPQRVIDRAPMASLTQESTKDPFDYGNLTENGYHDQLFRSFTEFLWGPEKILTKFLEGTLETEMQLRPGRILEYFGSTEAFIVDLGKQWNQFQSCFKRHQIPPVFVCSRRSGGSDMVESMFPQENTKRYYELLREAVLAATV